MPAQSAKVAQWRAPLVRLRGWMWPRLRRRQKPTARRTCQFAISTYLVPLLGHIEVARLRSDDIAEAFDTIREWNSNLAGGSPVRNHQRFVGPRCDAANQGSLRKALNDAEGLEFNPAEKQRVYMEKEERWKPIVLIEDRKAQFWPHAVDLSSSHRYPDGSSAIGPALAAVLATGAGGG
jgi:hypothetical protein